MSSISNVASGMPVSNLKPLLRGSDYAKQVESMPAEITDLGNGVVVERRGAQFKMTGDAKMSMRAKVTAYEAAQAGGKAGQAMFDTYRKTHPEEFGAAAVARDQALMSGKLPEPPPPPKRPPAAPSGDRVEVKDNEVFTAKGDGPVNVSGGSRVNVTGSAASDFITVLYNATVYGLAGNDRVSALDRATLDGGDGDDWLSAGKHSTLVGGAGNDILEAYDHSDLDGGDGDDLLSAYEDSTLVGGAGNDQLDAYERSVLDGGDGDDVLSAYEDSTLTGGAGNDRLSAGDNAVADGGTGDDRIEVYSGAQVTDSGGDNYISAYGHARVTAGAGNDTITAYDGSVIDAGDGDNYLDVGGGSTVTSGKGDDYVRVGWGSQVTAGAGDDNVVVAGQVVVHFNRGDGHDILGGGRGGLFAPTTTDRLSSSTVAFGAGILPSDLSVERAGEDDIVVTIGSDSLTLRGVSTHGIPTMTFTNGSTLNAEQVQAMADQTAAAQAAQRLRKVSQAYQNQVNTTGTAV